MLEVAIERPIDISMKQIIEEIKAFKYSCYLRSLSLMLLILAAVMAGPNIIKNVGIIN